MNAQERELYNSYCELFVSHYQKLTAFAYRRLLSWSDAQDVVQDVFLGMWQRRERMYAGCLKSYVYKAVISYSNQVHRIGGYNRKRRAEYEEFLLSRPIEYNIHAKEVRNLLAQAIEYLPPAQQKVVVLFYLKGEKQKDIAVKLGISYNVVKQQSSQAVKRMKVELKSRDIYLQ